MELLEAEDFAQKANTGQVYIKQDGKAGFMLTVNDEFVLSQANGVTKLFTAINSASNWLVNKGIFNFQIKATGEEIEKKAREEKSKEQQIKAAQDKLTKAKELLKKKQDKIKEDQEVCKKREERIKELEKEVKDLQAA